MSLNKYINRLERMDRLIKRKATGTPTEFAARMEMSRSLLMEYLRFMKQRGGLITYDRNEQTYRYEGDAEFFCGFKSSNGYIKVSDQSLFNEPFIVYSGRLAS